MPLVLGLLGCGETTSTTIEEPLGKGLISTPYYTSMLLRERGLVVLGSFETEYPNAEYTPLRVCFLGQVISGRDNPKFQRLADSVGDGHNTQLLSYAFHPAMSVSRVDGITLTSVSGYNATHPVGSSLNDIVRVSYHTYKFRLLEQEVSGDYLQTSPYEGAFASSRALAQVLPLEKIQIRASIPLGASSQPYAYQVFEMVLTEAPDKPMQEMKLSITLSNGEVLEHTFSANIWAPKK